MRDSDQRPPSSVVRFGYALQLMYTSQRPQNHHALYLRLVHRILKAAPSTRPYIKEINDKILAGEMYKALKEARKLIGYEKRLLEHALR